MPLEAVAIGIISGLITTFIVIVIQRLWVGAVEPWYEERIYKDAKLEGVWEGVYPGLDLKEIITLKRVAHRVDGVVAIVEGPDQGKTYEISGSFKNLILTANYHSVDRRSLDRGTYTLMLKNNGTKLEGHSAFYEDESHEVVSGSCVWTRKSS